MLFFYDIFVMYVARSFVYLRCVFEVALRVCVFVEVGLKFLPISAQQQHNNNNTGN